MEQYYTIHKVSKLLGVSTQTLRNWDKNGKLKPHHTTESGYRYYSREDLNKFMKIPMKERITIEYCRVSSNKQKEDLNRQIKHVRMYLLILGKPFEIIQDIGSGINYNKEGLQELLKKSSSLLLGYPSGMPWN